MKRTRISNISEIYDGEKLLFKDFSNLDLSNIDLSNIPMDAWEGCIFYNTNFSNTGIKFIPNKLSYKQFPDFGNRREKRLHRYYIKNMVSLVNCDLSCNDLSYLTPEDFIVKTDNKQYSFFKNIWIEGANFENTNIKVECLKYLYNVKLDKSFGEKDFSYWGDFDGKNAEIDFRTVVRNPFLNLSSSRLIRIFEKFVLQSDCIDLNLAKQDKYDVNLEKAERVVKVCEMALKYDKQGYFRKVYEQISPNLTLENKYWLFRITINNALLKDVDLTGIPMRVLRHYYFTGGNTFDNVKIDNRINELVRGFHSEQFYDGGNRNIFKELYLLGVDYGSWKEKTAKDRRISSSPITFFTKIYLELSRRCNAKCQFCRNETFEQSKYNFEQIAQTLNNIKEYLNAVVIGGGEPTLKLEDVMRLKQYCDAENIDWHMFTNGTNKSIIDNKDLLNNFKINLSRHAVDDLENASIFNVNPSKMMTDKDIEKLNAQNVEVTLNGTCFNGGLDTSEKIIEYIEFAKAIGCKKVLIQNLQKNSSLGTNGLKLENLHIDPKVFKEVAEYLQASNYRQKRYPIVASGGYITTIFSDKNNDFSVSIQDYISKEELLSAWPKAIKRSFDLSIDPSGNLYENWHQSSGLIKDLKTDEICK